MKRTMITISILLTFVLLVSFAFILKPSQENKRKIVKVGIMNLETFDLNDVLKKVTGENPENLDLYIDDFSMTVNNRKRIISLNFSFAEEQTFKDIKTKVHLHGVNHELIIKTELLDNGKNISIKDYLFSIFNIGNSRSLTGYSYVSNSNYFHNDQFIDLFANLKQNFIDDIDDKKEKLHIEILPKAFYTIYNNHSETYLVNTATGAITNIENITNDNRIKVVLEDNEVEAYKIDNLQGISSYTGSAGKMKDYFLDEH